MDKNITQEIINNAMGLVSGMGREQASQIEDIKQEYKERELKIQLEYNDKEQKREKEYKENIMKLEHKNRIAVVIVAMLGVILSTAIIVFGLLANNALLKHYEMDKILQEDIVVEFESEFTVPDITDDFGEIETGDNAKIGTEDVTIGDGNTLTDSLNDNSNNQGIIGDNNNFNTLKEETGGVK